MTSIIGFVFLALIAGIIYAIVGKKFGGGTAGPRVLTGFIIAGLLIGIGTRLFVIIDAGTVGVVDFWGKVSPTPLEAGVNMRNPLADIHSFSIKTMELKEDVDTPSKEGLITHLEVSLWYKVIPDKTPEIYRTIGVAYEDIILKPLIRSVLRSVTAEYEAKALYTAGREAIGAEILKVAEPVAREKGMAIDKVLLRAVKLPQLVAEAIERKLQAEQQSEQMKFVLDKERQEADRKRIEAQGIADFQKIVTQGITPSLLDWKGIEATEKLAASPNTKVVIIGNPKNGLPLILEGQK
ncbi:MAG: prohibitin family protein [Deltaproteobacteria bacterium]|nr:prohibitin family protein [Deltaproteobacteria bacterium]